MARRPTPHMRSAAIQHGCRPSPLDAGRHSSGVAYGLRTLFTSFTNASALPWMVDVSLGDVHRGFASCFAKADDIFVPHLFTFTGSGVSPFFAAPDSSVSRQPVLVLTALIFPPSHAEAGPPSTLSVFAMSSTKASTLPWIVAG